MRRLALDVAVAAAFLWLGFVIAISFLEAPLKFQAGVPHIHALAIGRVVFRWLNRVEWLLAGLSLVTTLLARPPLMTRWLLLAAVLLLAVQTFALLPALDERARAIIAGAPRTANSLHDAYIGLEIAKVLLLAATAWIHLRSRPVCV